MGADCKSVGLRLRRFESCTCHRGHTWYLAALALAHARANGRRRKNRRHPLRRWVCCPDFGGDHGVIHCALQIADAVGSERIGIRLSPGATLIGTDEPRPWLGPDCVMRRSQFDEMQNVLEELKV